MTNPGRTAGIPDQVNGTPEKGGIRKAVIMTKTIQAKKVGTLGTQVERIHLGITRRVILQVPIRARTLRTATKIATNVLATKAGPPPMPTGIIHLGTTRTKTTPLEAKAGTARAM